MNRATQSATGQDRITVLVPRPFPNTGQHSERYALVDLDAINADRTLREQVRGVALSGHSVFDATMMDSLPSLEIISRFGVGYDTIDLTAARERGIVVTNTPDVLTEEVADLALGLLIATVRAIPAAERFLRAGKWQDGTFPLTSSLRGRRVGIVGLGRIGRAIARRLSAMDLDVSYLGRTRQPDVPWRYFSDIVSLAEYADILVIVVPGGTDTEGLIDARVFAAMGPDGVLINVARGSVVDEGALCTALESGTIASAGLDVFAREPSVPNRLLQLDNVVLLPHVGSGTTTTRKAMGDLVYSNLDSWFAGKGAITPVTS